MHGASLHLLGQRNAPRSQWPFFAAVATYVPSRDPGVMLSVWCFLLCFTLRPIAHTVFAPMYHEAKTPVLAHFVTAQMKSYVKRFTLLALVFLLYGIQNLVWSTLDNMYPAQHGWVAKLVAFAEAPSNFDPELLFGAIPGVLVSFSVSYFVTFTALVDTVVQALNFIWQSDGYISNGRCCHSARSLPVIA